MKVNKFFFTEQEKITKVYARTNWKMKHNNVKMMFPVKIHLWAHMENQVRKETKIEFSYSYSLIKFFLSILDSTYLHKNTNDTIEFHKLKTNVIILPFNIIWSCK